MLLVASQLCLAQPSCIIDGIGIANRALFKYFMSPIAVELVWQAQYALTRSLIQQGDLAVSTASLTEPLE